MHYGRRGFIRKPGIQEDSPGVTSCIPAFLIELSFIHAALVNRLKGDLCKSVVCNLRSLFILLLVINAAGRVHAYVDLAPTLSRIVQDSRSIGVIELVEFISAEQTLVLKPIRSLKGDVGKELIRHKIAATADTIPSAIARWAQPGAKAVLFSSRATSLVCTGEGWYQVRAAPSGTWTTGAYRPDLPLAYHGSLTRLADAIELMITGKDAVITTVAYGSEDVQTSFDLALNRTSLPALTQVRRIRANLRMPPMVMAVSANPAYLIGPGRVDASDLPGLLRKLESPNADERAEAAVDLCSLPEISSDAIPRLRSLLSDAALSVRLNAAIALLRSEPSRSQALEVLRTSLESADANISRIAVITIARDSLAPTFFVPHCMALLNSKDEIVQSTALEALSVAGQPAAPAVSAITALLAKPSLEVAAADALGRIGPAAQPSVDALAKLLSSDQSLVRWAGVRAMSQIGGPKARPAVQFMIKALEHASEVEGYNMMIYLSLLGPDAKEAVPTLRSVRIKNPVLPSAALWAIQPEDGFPWQRKDRAGMPGFGEGGGEGPEFARYIYEAYLHELGPRLKPAALQLAAQIMNGTAGDVPQWGYKILACGGDEIISELTCHLSEDSLVKRERAAVALGYLGPAAAASKDALSRAIANTPMQREKLLLQWAQREVAGNSHPNSLTLHN